MAVKVVWQDAQQCLAVRLAVPARPQPGNIQAAYLRGWVVFFSINSSRADKPVTHKPANLDKGWPYPLPAPRLQGLHGYAEKFCRLCFRSHTDIVFRVHDLLPNGYFSDFTIPEHSVNYEFDRFLFLSKTKICV